jgi:hypothetical protein
MRTSLKVKSMKTLVKIGLNFSCLSSYESMQIEFLGFVDSSIFEKVTIPYQAAIEFAVPFSQGISSKTLMSLVKQEENGEATIASGVTMRKLIICYENAECFSLASESEKGLFFSKFEFEDFNGNQDLNIEVSPYPKDTTIEFAKIPPELNTLFKTKTVNA